MPFQGNPNAGQPDPALLNLLFQQKARREELAYKQQQDAIAAQRQAQLDAAEEERKNAEHRMKLAKDAFEIMNKAGQQEKAIGETQANNRQAKGAFAQAFPFISTPGTAAQGPSGGSVMEYGALPDQSIQNAYEQQQFGQQLDEPLNARIAALASVLNGISPEMQQYAESLPGQGMQAEFTRGRLQDEEAAKSQREFDRQAKKEKDAREDSARIAAEAPMREAVTTDRTIRGLSQQANKEKDPSKRAGLLADLRAATTARDAEMLKFTPGEAIKFREATLAKAEEYRRKHLATQMLAAIESRPDVLGFRPNTTQFLRNVVGTTSEILTFIAPTVNSVMQDPGISQAAKDRVEKMFVYHVNPDTGERLEEARLEEAADKWLLTMGVNESGRQSQKQLDEWTRLTNFSDPLVSVPVAIDRLRATRAFLQRDLDYVTRPELLGRGIQFEKDGRILGDPSFSWADSQPLTYEDIMGDGTPQAVDPLTGAPVGTANPPKNVRDPVQEAIDRRRANGS